MKFAIITGSHRPEGESGRVGAYAATRLKTLFADAEIYELNLGTNPLPLWDEGLWGKPSNVDWKSVWSPIAAELTAADALVVVSPEWGGMVPPALKNFLQLATGGVVAFKPAYIIGVSASRGGSYPIAELRMSGYKNTYLNWLPEHLIIRDVVETLKGDAPANPNDTYTRARMDYGLKLLAEHGKALKQVRDSGLIDLKNYPYGM